jgi:putative glutamine amidotransferase
VAEPGPGDELLEGFDGLLLAGGGDIDPNRYGADPHPDQYGVDPDRDATELDLLLAAREAGLPILAICRGIQLVNVATGGTLHQHLPDDTGRMTHGDPMGGLSASHGVTVTEGSALAEAVGATRIERCTSHHHQGVERVGGGLRAVGWSDDGLVEALEPAGEGPWMVAVQWHPEVTAEHDPVQQAIFDAFGLQCAAFADLATATSR